MDWKKITATRLPSNAKVAEQRISSARTDPGSETDRDRRAGPARSTLGGAAQVS